MNLYTLMMFLPEASRPFTNFYWHRKEVIYMRKIKKTAWLGKLVSMAAIIVDILLKIVDIIQKIKAILPRYLLVPREIGAYIL